MTPRTFLALSLASAALIFPVGASALEEAHTGTHFQVYVPPNGNNAGRPNALVITAQAGTSANACIVTATDKTSGAHTQNGVSLVKGESLVIYIRDGSRNDDYGGLADGVYFVVDSTLPVAVNYASDSDWEHDWAPATSGTLRGSEFFLYAQQTNQSNRDIDVFAYENGTHVEIYDVTAGTPLLSKTGIAHVGPRSATPVLSADLNEGEDLNRRYGLGKDLFTFGHVYQVAATKDVTVLYGSIDTTVAGLNQARDGAGFVPGRTGHAIDNDFYFAIPHNPGMLSEQELRVVAATQPVTVTLKGWNTTTNAWVVITTWNLKAFGHADYVGGTYDLYHLTSTGGNVTVYEANWMETGQQTTSDDADFAPGFFNADGSETFVVYLGPPGDQTLTTQKGIYSHVYLYSFAGEAAVWVRDADTNGTIFNQTVSIPAQGYADVRIGQTQWNAMNNAAAGRRPYLRIDSPTPIAVNMANWNDNVMAFATAVLPLNPKVDVVPPPAATVGSTVTVGGSVTNQGTNPITSVETRVTVPTGLTYVSGTLAGLPQTSVAPVTAGTEVVYNLQSLAPGQSAPLAMNVTVTASAGQVAAVNVSTTAKDAGVIIGQTGSAATRPPANAVATISNLVAGASNTAVVLNWNEQADTGIVSTITVQRSAALTGPWTAIAAATRTSTGVGVPVNASFTNTGLTNNTNYYYQVVATGSAAQVSTAGPVLARPTNNTPPPTPVCSTIPSSASISVVLGGSGTPDLKGYLVERASSSAGPWSVITASPVLGATTTAAVTVADGNLVNGSVYWYRARAQNTSNLYSSYCVAISDVPGANSTRTSNNIVYFEDMLGPGTNDWDYNDFVVRVAATEVVSGGDLSAITIDYEPLARGASYIHMFRQHLPVQGNWTATLTRFVVGNPSQVASRNTTAGTGPIDIEIYADTRTALAPATGSFTNTQPSQVGFQAGALARLEITLTTPGANPDGALGAAPWDAYLKLPYLTGPQGNEIHRALYGGSTEIATSGPLVGTPIDFVLVHPLTIVAPSWAYEGTPVWNSYPSFIPYQQTVGPADANWPDRPTSREDVFDQNH